MLKANLIKSTIPRELFPGSKTLIKTQFRNKLELNKRRQEQSHNNYINLLLNNLAKQKKSYIFGKLVIQVPLKFRTSQSQLLIPTLGIIMGKSSFKFTRLI